MELTWLDDRWHLNGRGIHAGECVELRWPDGTWEPVRVESGNRGRLLYAHFEYHGQGLCVRLDEGDYSLRWPSRQGAVACRS